MSKYTTGEIARLCGVTVRTVQYYDSRNILVPSQLSEGGRRLYSEEDLKRMKVICFLREAGIPINGIHELFTEEHPEQVISILLDQQARELREELAEAQKKLGMVESIRRELKEIPRFSVETIGDIAQVMRQKKKLTRMRTVLMLLGVPLNVLQWTAIILWIARGIRWPFALWAWVAVPFSFWVLISYRRYIAYICPACHAGFQPGFREMFFARHTLKMRRLTCPHCGHNGLCIEVINEQGGK